MGYSHGDHNSAGMRYIRLRQERLSASPLHHTPEEWEATKAMFDYRCVCCGRKEDRHCMCCGIKDVIHDQPWRQGAPYFVGDFKMTRDHITPVSQGGHDGIDNIQPLCWGCQVTKGTRTTDYRPLWGVMQ